MGQTKKIVVCGALALAIAVAGAAGYALAAPSYPLKFVPLGSAEGLFRDTGIVKMFDPGENVVCYVFAPERVSHKLNASGQALYEGNHVGSISCVKRDGPPPAGSPPPARGVR